MIESNDHKNFREVHAKEWKDAANNTTDTKQAHKDTLDRIEAAKTNLKAAKAEEDRKAALVTDPPKSPEDLTKEANLREKLLNNQLKKLDELKTQIENTVTKLPEDVLEGIRNTPLKGEATDPDSETKQNLAQGTVEEMNKALVKSQLKKMTGGDCIWASVRHDGQTPDEISLSQIDDAKPGVYRANRQKRGYGDLFLCLTVVGALYVLFKQSTFCINKDGSIGWSTKDAFSRDFFTAFQGKHPGKPMYLTFGANMTEKYFEDMVKDARTRRPILILELSDKCKATLGPAKTQVFEDILKRDVGFGDAKGVGAIAVAEEEKSGLHVRTRNNAP